MVDELLAGCPKDNEIARARDIREWRYAEKKERQGPAQSR